MCVLSGKSYIGYTKFTVVKRWLQHCKDAINGSNNAFHKALRKYGTNGWKHELLEECVGTEQDVGLREMYWIGVYSSTINKNGYNMTLGGLNRLTVWSPEMKEYHRKRTSEGTKNAFRDQAIRQRHKDATKIASNDPINKKRNSEAQIIAQNRPDVRQKHSFASVRTWNDPTSKLCARKKMTQQIDRVTGAVIATYVSAHDAGRVLGLSQGSISNCARGITKSAGGFIWRYVNKRDHDV